MLPATPRLALGLLALLVGLTACSGDPEPIYADPTPEATGPSSTATPSATPSPSGSGGTPSTGSPSSPPTTPVPADESAREFLIRFQAEAFAMQESGDTSRYRSMASSCLGCTRLANAVDRIYEAGGYIELTPGQISGLKLLATTDAVRIFEYDLTEYPARFSATADGPVERLTGGTTRYQVNVASARGDWVIERSERV